MFDNHKDVPKDKLRYVIVQDVGRPSPIDKTMQSDPPFGTIVYTASPFHFNVTDTKKDLLNPVKTLQPIG